MTLSTGCGESSDDGEGSDNPDSEPTGHKGAFTVTLGPVDPLFAAGRTCPTTETFTFGDPPPTPTTPAGLIQDGASAGVGVFCVVVTAGNNPYIVDVSAIQGADTPNAMSLQLSSQSADLVAGAVDGELLIDTPSTLPLHSRDSLPCTIAPIRTLEGGAIAADFYCPCLLYTSDAADEL